MQPPLPQQDVAGIGHRFGQQMDVGEPQHSGVDLQAPEGTPTQSPVDGFVADVIHDPQGLGLTVVIQGQDGSQHKLGHLSKTQAYRGMQVARGQDLGSAVGSTGLSTGAHLHWGVKDPQGQPVDPTQALGPMAQMPPVPGTEQMGPPGGSGSPGVPPSGAGHMSNARNPKGFGTGQQTAKPGWQPKPKPRAKRRWGKPDPSLPGAGADLSGYGEDVTPTHSNAPKVNAWEGQGGTLEPPAPYGATTPNPSGLPRMPRVQINPMHAFGTGQQQEGGMPASTQSPDYQAGYQAGMQASQSPGTPPLFVPGMAQPIPGAQDMSQGFGGQGQGQGGQQQMGGGQETADGLWDKYQAREVQGAMGAGANPNPLEMQWIHHNPTELPRDDPLLRPGGSSSTSKAAGLWGADPMQGLKQLGPVDIDPGEAFGSGQMGAGGVYVKSPDGSMHWDETKPDPSDSGGSVIDSQTGQPIPGANRQSGPTGPGGTGPPGSQARAAHVGELMANPSFISTGGGSIFPGGRGGLLSNSPQSEMDAALWAGGPSPTNTTGQNPAGSNQSVGGKLSSAGFSAPNTNPTPHAVAGELDPTAFKNYGVKPSWPGYSGFGTIPVGGGNVGAGAQMGAGDATSNTTSADIQPYDLGSLINGAATIQVNANAEANRHQEALLQMAQNWSIHQDDLAYQQSVEAENQRHNQATEELTRSQQGIDVQLAQLDSQTKIQVQNSINQTALQQEQMKEANSVQLAQMQEGTQIYMQQGQQAFQDWQTRQQSQMAILSSALNNPWMQQLTGMTPSGAAGAPMNSANISNLVKQVLQPYDTSAFGAQNAPPGTVPGGTQATAGAQQQQPGAAAGGLGAQAGTPDTATPSWQQWQSLSPWQKAAYRTNIEALGPGAWNAQQGQMQTQFGQQGGSADVTQLAAAAASPTDQIGQQMTAEAFGQTPQQWATNQQKNWSASAAPSVKQNLGASQGGPSSSNATPEQQYGI
jgi:hypothetical protein